MRERFHRVGTLRPRTRSARATVLGLLLAAAMPAAADPGRNVELQRFHHQSRVPDGGAVILHNAWGDIRVKTGGKLARFSAVMQKIGEQPHVADFTHTVEGGNLVLRVDYPDADQPASPRAGRVDAALVVPHGTPLILHADRGRVLTKTLDAPIKVYATDGEITIKTRARVDLHALGGAVRLTLRPADTALDYGRVNTRTGDVEVQFADDLPLDLDIRTGASITTNDAVLLDSRTHADRRTAMHHADADHRLRIDSDSGRVILVNRSRLNRQ